LERDGKSNKAPLGQKGEPTQKMRQGGGLKGGQVLAVKEVVVPSRKMVHVDKSRLASSRKEKGVLFEKEMRHIKKPDGKEEREGILDRLRTGGSSLKKGGDNRENINEKTGV